MTSQNKKVLLIGDKSAGKRTHYKILCRGTSPNESDTVAYDPRLWKKPVEDTEKILKTHIIQVLDCDGGQPFMNIASKFSETVFSNTVALVYFLSFDRIIGALLKPESDLLKDVLQCLKRYSPEAHVFVLVNKKDLVHDLLDDGRYMFLKKKIRDIYNEVYLGCSSTTDSFSLTPEEANIEDINQYFDMNTHVSFTSKHKAWSGWRFVVRSLFSAHTLHELSSLLIRIGKDLQALSLYLCDRGTNVEFCRILMNLDNFQARTDEYALKSEFCNNVLGDFQNLAAKFNKEIKELDIDHNSDVELYFQQNIYGYFMRSVSPSVNLCVGFLHDSDDLDQAITRKTISDNIRIGYLDDFKRILEPEAV